MCACSPLLSLWSFFFPHNSILPFLPPSPLSILCLLTHPQFHINPYPLLFPCPSSSSLRFRVQWSTAKNPQFTTHKQFRLCLGVRRERKGKVSKGKEGDRNEGVLRFFPSPCLGVQNRKRMGNGGFMFFF